MFFCLISKKARCSFAGLLALAVLGAAFVVSGRAAPQAGEKLQDGAKLVKIEAEPARIELDGPFACAQVLLLGHCDNGAIVDLTRLARLEKESDVAIVSDRGQVRPVRDGKGVLRFGFDGQSVEVAVQVSRQNETLDVSFVRDVMPVLSKLGCNAGTCHGSAQGKNGFQLSLRGYDPLFDHQALTDDVMGRRFNRAAPDKSLMLMKPSGEVAHVGGVVMQPADRYYKLLRLWIAEGARLDLTTPRARKLEILPANVIVPLPGMKQQMRVIASYADGSTRDVTAEAFVESSNIEIATVDKQGLATAVRRGETAIMARYEGSYTAATMIVMGDRSGFTWEELPEYNWIDGLVFAKLKQIQVLPSKLCTDEEFIRRIYLDLTGLTPRSEQVRAFVADPLPSKQKREVLVDQLIGSPEYVDHWTNKWSDLLQVNSKFLGNQGAKALRDWVRKAVADNMPYDQMARAVLTASGSTMENPPAAYYKILRDPGAAMENTTHLFLAVRFNCNKCHDHPFERWTQNNYYNMAAFFAQIERKEDPKFKGQKIGGSAVDGAKPLVELITDKAAGEVKHERTGETAKPAFPFEIATAIPNELPRRERLAQWITSPDNPYFARSYVNRVWSYLLGVGLIEPIDDIRAGNPPSNPKLLQALSAEFVRNGFNVRELVRLICKSRTYQQSIETNRWNKDDEVNYSHALARRLPAEVLYDAIHQVTGSTSKLPGLAAGAKASQLLDPSAPVPGGFLEVFGKPARESACECERTNSMLLGPVLNLVNGPVLGEALKDPNNKIAKLAAREKDDAKLVEELFLTILCRKPTAAELNASLTEFQVNGEDYRQLAADHAKRVAALQSHEATLPKKQEDWEAELKANPAWSFFSFDEMQADGGTKLEKQSDLSILASGPNPTPQKYVLTTKVPNSAITALRLEVLADKSLPKNGPGRADNGNFVLNDFKVFVSPDGDPMKFKQVKLTGARATFQQDGFAAAQAIDDNLETGWAIAPQFGRDHMAIFEIKSKGAIAGGGVVKIEMLQKHDGKKHAIGKFRLAFSTHQNPVPFQGVPVHIAKLIDLPVAERTAEQLETLKNYYRSTDNELARLQRSLAELTLPPDARTMAAQDIAWALINSPAFLFNR
jgi:hypothetical protein